METVWEFCTAQLVVTLDIEPEDMDPAESFEFEEDIAAVRNGEVAWFQARVAVWLIDCGKLHSRQLVGADYLGGCAYARVADFYTSHRDPDPMNRNCSIMRDAKGKNVGIGHYFPDMVRTAVKAAREQLRQLPRLRNGEKWS